MDSQENKLKPSIDADSPIIIPRAFHNISRKLIDKDALKVLYRLKQFGYCAFLVGGGVRDLLLGKTPKDFDIGTDAPPKQIKKIFRNCRIIGKRFRIAHILFGGGKIIEVTTFRGESPEKEGERICNPDGSLRRDNVYGSPAEDALRRDFTINGLFYDIKTFSVIDYVGGLKDLEDGVIRTIGDPDVRFREDPVRMIRAVRHASRTNFDIEEETLLSIQRNKALILNSSKSRLCEEFLKELRGGNVKKSIQTLASVGLLACLLPELDAFITDEFTENELHRGHLDEFWKLLGRLDRVNRYVLPDDAVLLGALILPFTRYHVAKAVAEGTFAREGGAREEILKKAVRPLVKTLGVGRKDSDKVIGLIQSVTRLEDSLRKNKFPKFLLDKTYVDDIVTLFLLANGKKSAEIPKVLFTLTPRTVTRMAEVLQLSMPAKRKTRGH